MDINVAETSANLTSTMGSVLSNPETIENTSTVTTVDSLPSSSSDASFNEKTPAAKHEDAISSTSDVGEALDSSAEEIEAVPMIVKDKETEMDDALDLFANECNLSEIPNSTITEDVEDIVSDLENLLGDAAFGVTSLKGNHSVDFKLDNIKKSVNEGELMQTELRDNEDNILSKLTITDTDATSVDDLSNCLEKTNDKVIESTQKIDTKGKDEVENVDTVSSLTEEITDKSLQNDVEASHLTLTKKQIYAIEEIEEKMTTDVIQNESVESKEIILNTDKIVPSTIANQSSENTELNVEKQVNLLSTEIDKSDVQEPFPAIDTIKEKGLEDTHMIVEDEENKLEDIATTSGLEMKELSNEKCTSHIDEVDADTSIKQIKETLINTKLPNKEVLPMQDDSSPITEVKCNQMDIVVDNAETVQENISEDIETIEIVPTIVEKVDERIENIKPASQLNDNVREEIKIAIEEIVSVIEKKSDPIKEHIELVLEIQETVAEETKNVVNEDIVSVTKEVIENMEISKSDSTQENEIASVTELKVNQIIKNCDSSSEMKITCDEKEPLIDDTASIIEKADQIIESLLPLEDTSMTVDKVDLHELVDNSEIIMEHIKSTIELEKLPIKVAEENNEISVQFEEAMDVSDDCQISEVITPTIPEKSDNKETTLQNEIKEVILENNLNKNEEIKDNNIDESMEVDIEDEVTPVLENVVDDIVEQISGINDNEIIDQISSKTPIHEERTIKTADIDNVASEKKESDNVEDPEKPSTEACNEISINAEEMTNITDIVEVSVCEKMESDTVENQEKASTVGQKELSLLESPPSASANKKDDINCAPKEAIPVVTTIAESENTDQEMDTTSIKVAAEKDDNDCASKVNSDVITTKKSEIPDNDDQEMVATITKEDSETETTIPVHTGKETAPTLITESTEKDDNNSASKEVIQDVTTATQSESPDNPDQEMTATTIKVSKPDDINSASKEPIPDVITISKTEISVNPDKEVATTTIKEASETDVINSAFKEAIPDGITISKTEILVNTDEKMATTIIKEASEKDDINSTSKEAIPDVTTFLEAEIPVNTDEGMATIIIKEASEKKDITSGSEAIPDVISISIAEIPVNTDEEMETTTINEASEKNDINSASEEAIPDVISISKTEIPLNTEKEMVKTTLKEVSEKDDSNFAKGSPDSITSSKTDIQVNTEETTTIKESYEKDDINSTSKSSSSDVITVSKTENPVNIDEEMDITMIDTTNSASKEAIPEISSKKGTEKGDTASKEAIPNDKTISKTEIQVSTDEEMDITTIKKPIEIEATNSTSKETTPAATIASETEIPVIINEEMDITTIKKPIEIDATNSTSREATPDMTIASETEIPVIINEEMEITTIKECTEIDATISTSKQDTPETTSTDSKIPVNINEEVVITKIKEPTEIDNTNSASKEAVPDEITATKTEIPVNTGEEMDMTMIIEPTEKDDTKSASKKAIPDVITVSKPEIPVNTVEEMDITMIEEPSVSKDAIPDVTKIEIPINTENIEKDKINVAKIEVPVNTDQEIAINTIKEYGDMVKECPIETLSKKTSDKISINTEITIPSAEKGRPSLEANILNTRQDTSVESKHILEEISMDATNEEIKDSDKEEKADDVNPKTTILGKGEVVTLKEADAKELLKDIVSEKDMLKNQFPENSGEVIALTQEVPVFHMSAAVDNVVTQEKIAKAVTTEESNFNEDVSDSEKLLPNKIEPSVSKSDQIIVNKETGSLENILDIPEIVCERNIVEEEMTNKEDITLLKSTEGITKEKISEEVSSAAAKISIDEITIAQSMSKSIISKVEDEASEDTSKIKQISSEGTAELILENDDINMEVATSSKDLEMTKSQDTHTDAEMETEDILNELQASKIIEPVQETTSVPDISSAMEVISADLDEAEQISDIPKKDEEVVSKPIVVEESVQKIIADTTQEKVTPICTDELKEIEDVIEETPKNEKTEIIVSEKLESTQVLDDKTNISEIKQSETLIHEEQQSASEGVSAPIIEDKCIEILVNKIEEIQPENVVDTLNDPGLEAISKIVEIDEASTAVENLQFNELMSIDETIEESVSEPIIMEEPEMETNDEDELVKAALEASFESNKEINSFTEATQQQDNLEFALLQAAEDAQQRKHQENEEMALIQAAQESQKREEEELAFLQAAAEAESVRKLEQVKINLKKSADAKKEIELKKKLAAEKEKEIELQKAEAIKREEEAVELKKIEEAKKLEEIELKKVEEAKQKQEAIEQKKIELAKKKQEEIDLKNAEEEKKLQKELELKNIEAAKKKKEEEIEIKKAEALKKKQEDLELKRVEAAKRRSEIELRKAEAAKKRQNELELKKAEALKKQEELEQKKIEAAKKKQEEMELKKAEAKKKQDEIDLKKAEAAKKKQEELELKKAEAARKKQEDIELKKVEAAKKKKQEEIDLKKAEAAKKKQEELEAKKAEAAKKKQEELELKKAEAARKKQEELELKKAEAAKKKQEELELKKAEAAKKKQEELEAKLKAEAVKKKQEEAAKKKQEEADLKKAEAAKKKQEEAELKKAEAAKKKQEMELKKAETVKRKQAEIELKKAEAIRKQEEIELEATKKELKETTKKDNKLFEKSTKREHKEIESPTSQSKDEPARKMMKEDDTVVEASQREYKEPLKIIVEPHVQEVSVVKEAQSTTSEDRDFPNVDISSDEDKSAEYSSKMSRSQELKLTIRKNKTDEPASILKIYDPEDSSDISDKVMDETPIPKLIIKQSQCSPKVHSPLKIKPMMKSEELQRSSPKLIIKPIIKPEEETLHIEEKHHSPKLKFKSIPKPVSEESERSHSPKVTIKPIVKPVETNVSPKIKIKPIVKPADDNEETQGVERIVLKINKGNTPHKEVKKSEENEKLAKIKLKFSKEGGHPRIINEAGKSQKRSHSVEPEIPEKKSKIESESIPNVDSSILSESMDTTIDTSLDITPSNETPKSEPEVLTPAPKKRGRPRKIPLQIREEFPKEEKEEKRGRPRKGSLLDVSQEAAVEPMPEQEPPASLDESNESPSGRPKRSCRGPSVRATLGLKTRKPRAAGSGLRGRGRGRGGKVEKPPKKERISESKLKLIREATLTSQIAEAFDVKRDFILKLESETTTTETTTDNRESEIKLEATTSEDTAALKEECIDVKEESEESNKQTDVIMDEEETRMSAETSSSRAQTPAKQQPLLTEVVEESQSSMQSTATSESVKAKKVPRCEVEAEGGAMTAEQLSEYSWGGGGPYMLQEQVAQYLGIKSFKRKYPGLARRTVDMQERDYIRENGLASEHMCDLGLTAVTCNDILDIMYTDFQVKYEEYCKFQRDRQTKEIANRQKALSLAATQEKTKLDITQQAVESAAQWNANFNKTRKEERRACMDLQTFTVNFPKGRVKQISKAKVGNYPIALVPGQYTDHYKRFTPTEINNMPLNTMLYVPLHDPNQEESSECSSDSSSSSSSGSDSSDSDSSDEDCNLCSPNATTKKNIGVNN